MGLWLDAVFPVTPPPPHRRLPHNKKEELNELPLLTAIDHERRDKTALADGLSLSLPLQIVEGAGAGYCASRRTDIVDEDRCTSQHGPCVRQ